MRLEGRLLLLLDARQWQMVTYMVPGYYPGDWLLARRLWYHTAYEER